MDGGNGPLEQDFLEALEEYRTKGDILAYIKRQGLIRFSGWKAAAEQGKDKAQWLLANCLLQGSGAEKNLQSGIWWLEKAADSGLAVAQSDLGDCIYDGIGVEEDKTKALGLYKKAADQGFPEALLNIAWCYWEGGGVSPDYAEAFRWYQKGAEENWAWGYFGLGDCYSTGKGVEQDFSQAIGFYRKAADMGFRWAQSELGWYYETGKGVKKNPVEAVRWYQLAADQGLDYAQFNLGRCYHEGKGMEQDLAKAVEWYQKAADQGHKKAKRALAQQLKKKDPTLRGLWETGGLMELVEAKAKEVGIPLEEDWFWFHPPHSSNPTQIQIYWCGKIEEEASRIGLSLCYMFNCDETRTKIGSSFCLRLMVYFKSDKAREQLKEMNLVEGIPAEGELVNWWQWENLWTGESYTLQDFGEADLQGLAKLFEDGARRTYSPVAKKFLALAPLVVIPPDEVSDEAIMRELLQQLGQIIIYGSPGTGKTRAAKRLALDVLTGKAPEEMSSEDEIEGKLERFREASRFDIVVFHPAYEYEQFVGGIGPAVEGLGASFSGQSRAVPAALPRDPRKGTYGSFDYRRNQPR